MKDISKDKVSFINAWDEFFNFTGMTFSDFAQLFSSEKESIYPFTITHDLKVIKNSSIIIDLYHVIQHKKDMIDDIKIDKNKDKYGITKIYIGVLADKLLSDIESELAQRGITLDTHKKHN